MFNTTFLIIYCVIAFVIIYSISYLIINKRERNKISFLGALIPPVVIISIIVLAGNFIYKLNPTYIPQGEPKEYELFEISIVADVEDEKARPTDGDVCIAYYELDEAYYEYMDSIVYPTDEDGEALGSDVPIEIMGEDITGEDEDGEHDGGEVNRALLYPEPSIKGDLCLGKNLVEIQNGYEQAKVYLYDAKADPTKFFSLFSLGDKQTYHLVRMP